MTNSKKISLIVIIAAIIILIVVGIILGLRIKKEEIPTAETDQAPEQTQIATPDSTVKTATADEKKTNLKEIAEQYLPTGQEIEHQVLQGSFGPWDNAILFFYKEKECFQCKFKGKVLIPQQKGYKQLNLPDFNQFDNETVDNIKIASVMFTNLDQDEENEIIILNEGYKKGPDGWPIFNTAVLNWQDRQYVKFGEMHKWESYFDEHCENAACLKKYIQAYSNLAGKFKIKNDYIAGDLEVTMTETGNLVGSWDAGYSEGHTCGLDFFVNVIEAYWAKIVVGHEEKGNIVILKNDRIEINFDTDLSEYDCGYGHPYVMELQRQ